MNKLTAMCFVLLKSNFFRCDSWILQYFGRGKGIIFLGNRFWLLNFDVGARTKGFYTYEKNSNNCHIEKYYNQKILAHPISWYWLLGFFLWMLHNVLVLNRKVTIDKERHISKRLNAISRLYPKGTYISHGQ